MVVVYHLLLQRATIFSVDSKISKNPNFLKKPKISVVVDESSFLLDARNFEVPRLRRSTPTDEWENRFKNDFQRGEGNDSLAPPAAGWHPIPGHSVAMTNTEKASTDKTWTHTLRGAI